MTEHQYKTMKFVLNADGNYDGSAVVMAGADGAHFHLPTCVIQEVQGEWVAEILDNVMNIDELRDIVAFIEHLETTEDV